MFIIPILGITSPILLLCGIIAPIAGLIKLVGSLFGYDIPYVVVQFGRVTLSPFPAFLYSAIVGILLLLLGRGAWKLLLRYIHTVSKTKQDLAV